MMQYQHQRHRLLLSIKNKNRPEEPSFKGWCTSDITEVILANALSDNGYLQSDRKIFVTRRSEIIIVSLAKTGRLQNA